MGTRPAWTERLSLFEREVSAWVGWVEQFRSRLRRILGGEDHGRAGCRATKLFLVFRDQGGKQSNSEAYVD
jgi:hypothetical protein